MPYLNFSVLLSTRFRMEYFFIKIIFSFIVSSHLLKPSEHSRTTHRLLESEQKLPHKIIIPLWNTLILTCRNFQLFQLAEIIGPLNFQLFELAGIIGTLTFYLFELAGIIVTLNFQLFSMNIFLRFSRGYNWKFSVPIIPASSNNWKILHEKIKVFDIGMFTM